MLFHAWPHTFIAGQGFIHLFIVWDTYLFIVPQRINLHWWNAWNRTRPLHIPNTHPRGITQDRTLFGLPQTSRHRIHYPWLMCHQLPSQDKVWAFLHSHVQWFIDGLHDSLIIIKYLESQILEDESHLCTHDVSWEPPPWLIRPLIGQPPVTNTSGCASHRPRLLTGPWLAS